MWRQTSTSQCRRRAVYFWWLRQNTFCFVDGSQTEVWPPSFLLVERQLFKPGVREWFVQLIEAALSERFAALKTQLTGRMTRLNVQQTRLERRQRQIFVDVSQRHWVAGWQNRPLLMKTTFWQEFTLALGRWTLKCLGRRRRRSVVVGTDWFCEVLGLSVVRRLRQLTAVLMDQWRQQF